MPSVRDGMRGAVAGGKPYRDRLRRRDEPLPSRLVELAREKPRFEYRRLHVLLGREGYRVNHKRMHRLSREAGLMIRRKQRKQCWPGQAGDPWWGARRPIGSGRWTSCTTQWSAGARSSF